MMDPFPPWFMPVSSVDSSVSHMVHSFANPRTFQSGQKRIMVVNSQLPSIHAQTSGVKEHDFCQ